MAARAGASAGCACVAHPGVLLQRLQEIVSDTPDQKLRLSVDAGGCSGFQYKFSLVDSIQGDDMCASLLASKALLMSELSRGVYAVSVAFLLADTAFSTAAALMPWHAATRALFTPIAIRHGKAGPDRRPPQDRFGVAPTTPALSSAQ